MAPLSSSKITLHHCETLIAPPKFSTLIFFFQTWIFQIPHQSLRKIALNASTVFSHTPQIIKIPQTTINYRSPLKRKLIVLTKNAS
jgi:hypothetical protein